MNTRSWIGTGLATGLLGALAAQFACSSSSAPPPPPTSVGGQCATSPGQFPTPNCVDYAAADQMCNATPANCPTSPCTANSPCLALGADNSGQTTASLRIRKLNVTAPPPLAKPFVQAAVIDQGINLHNQCSEAGDGTFSWLIQFDTTTHEVKTGGAAPTTDPFGMGYCFVDTMIEGLAVKPITVPTTANADGSFSTGVIPKLYVPIFAPDTQNPGKFITIVLPLSGAKVENVTLSDSNNCIGTYNADAVTPVPGKGCSDDPTSCARWTTAGSLGGYMTLKEADGVLVPQLTESLCVLLTGGASVSPMTGPGGEKLCARDGSGNIMAKGDYCSTSNSAGGCQDSYWLASTFAASAAKIVAPNRPECMGVPIGGGMDAGGGG